MNGAATPVSPGVSNRGTVSGLGVSPFMIGSGGPRMTSSVISGAVGGTLNRNVNSGTSINIPSFGGSRVNLGPNNASRGLGMQGPGRPMNSILQQASRQIVSLLGNTFSNSLGSVGQGQSLATGNGQLNSVGLMNDGVSSDVVPFDLNEFPQLSTHPSSAGSQGSLASLRKQGVNPFVQQNQDFSIQNEDFPALPGFKGGSNDFSTGLHQKDLQHERDLALMQSQHFGHRRFIAIAASKNRQERTSYSDQLLDYIEGGPKLRKWYGAPDQTRKDSGDSEFLENGIEGQQLTDEVRDAVLVTDADSMTGQLVMLSLIVKRARIRALVKDEKEMVQAFGSYVEPVVGDVADPNSLKKALRGVRAVFCSTKVGALSDKDVTRGIEHIVFLSQARQGF